VGLQGPGSRLPHLPFIPAKEIEVAGAKEKADESFRIEAGLIFLEEANQKINPHHERERYKKASCGDQKNHKRDLENEKIHELKPEEKFFLP